MQWLLYLIINSFFIAKYVPRAGINPWLAIGVFVLVTTSLWLLYTQYIKTRITPQKARILCIALFSVFTVMITLSLIFIDPLSIRVDRWSATTCFLDALFAGDYPYGVHTHISENNFPSPFPLWHYLQIPFWAIGDVGWQLLFFLALFLAAVYYYSRSWTTILTVMLLLAMSPAYWWEVATRSDGLSNALLVLAAILFMERRPLPLNTKYWWSVALIVGCLAATRLSAVIPLALYLFRPWLDTDWKKKIAFLLVVVTVVLAFFAPYILWDTQTWIFFQRNPFMSQSTPGNTWLLLGMVVIAMVVAYNNRPFTRFLSSTAYFLFAFMLITQLVFVFSLHNYDILNTPNFDVSYLTLALPYLIMDNDHTTTL